MTWSSISPPAGKKRNSFPPVTASLRKLTVCAASILLERFDRTMQKLNMDSLVHNMTALRSRGFHANDFVKMVLWKGDPTPLTGQQTLKFLTFGSPALRFILHQIHTYVLPADPNDKPRKLLITEDIPLSAQFWEMCMYSIYVNSAVLHAGLSDLERVQLLGRFNNAADNLLVLVIMHSVSPIAHYAIQEQLTTGGSCTTIRRQTSIVWWWWLVPAGCWSVKSRKTSTRHRFEANFLATPR